MNSVQRVTDFVAPSPKWDVSFNPLLPSRLRDLFGRRARKTARGSDGARI